MKLANPLYYPLAVLLGAIVLVVGVRVVHLPRLAMLAVAVLVATTAAAWFKASTPDSLELDNPELEQQLQQIRQQAIVLAERANGLRLEASRLLTTVDQLELLGTIQYACDRTSELPTKVDRLARRLQGDDSLLSVAELQQQLQEVHTKRLSSSSVAQAQFARLAEQLQRNIELAQQGQDARQAQVVNLSIWIHESGGLLQELQNKLRSADLTNAAAATEVRSLSDEFKSFQDNVDLLVSLS